MSENDDLVWCCPSDDDARNRPACRIRNRECDEWIPGVLVAVIDFAGKIQPLYAVRYDRMAHDVVCYCEIQLPRKRARLGEPERNVGFSAMHIASTAQQPNGDSGQ